MVGTNEESKGFVPTIEVSDIRSFVRDMAKKSVEFSSGIMEFGHIFLVKFRDPAGNRLQAFQWKGKD